MTIRFDNRVAIVTGAGNGLGRAHALLLASRGAKVVVNDPGGAVDGKGGGHAAADKVVDEIKAAGGQAVANYDSVADAKAAANIVKTAVDSYGTVDIVVNNAGVLRDVIFHKMTEKDWDIVRSVNLDGYFYMSRAAAPFFKDQGSGAYVHMTSTSALIGNMGQANYSAAKLGVVGLSKSIAIDMQRFGVRSNCISPFAFTRMVGTIPANTPENERRLEVAKRMTPDKIAPVAVFLLSEAAGKVNGQIFAVRANEVFLMSQSRPLRSIHRDGGWTPEQLAERLPGAFAAQFYPLAVSADVFAWDPI